MGGNASLGTGVAYSTLTLVADWLKGTIALNAISSSQTLGDQGSVGRPIPHVRLSRD